MAFKKEQLADDVVLYCGDCREVVPTLGKLVGVDVVVDSPYGIEDLVGNSYGRPIDSTGKRRLIANDKNLDVVGEAFGLVRKALARNAWVAAFYSCRITPDFMTMMNEAGYKDYFGEMIWDKKMPGMGGQIRYQHENIAFFKIGKPVDLMDCMSVISFVGNKANSGDSGHPHEKPDKVMDSIVSMMPGKTILDPFAGTFSTGAAAVRAKRGFIGIELDPKYFEVGIKKVTAALKQPEAFWEA